LTDIFQLGLALRSSSITAAKPTDWVPQAVMVQHPFFKC